MRIKQVTIFRHPIRWFSWYFCWKRYYEDLEYKKFAKEEEGK